MDWEREASSSSSASALFMEEEGEEGLPTVMLKAMLSSAMMSRQEEEVEKEEEGEEQQGGKQKRRHSLMARPTASTSLLSQTLEHCLRAMFKGNPPQQKQSSVCGKIWGSGHMAYRCKNCQVTPNSCICVDCFQKGNHEGHDYRLYSSGYGGCCDCGDPEAWNPKGFCSDHGAQAQAQLQNFSQDVARELILTALRLLQRYLKQYLSFSRTKQNRRDSRKLITLLLWLHKVCSYGDIPRRIVAEVVVNLTQEQDVSKKQLDEEAESKQKTPAEISLTKKITIPQATIIDLLLRACCHMERDEKKEDSDEEPKDTLSNSCMMLCMDCLYEPSFKATFAHRYVQNYGMLFLSSLHSGKTRQMDRILTTLGAQLFNIESLVVSITKQDKLLNTLLNLIILLVEEYSVLKKPQKRELTASSTAAVSAEVEGGEEEEEAEVEVEEDGPETRRERELERQRRVEEMTEQVEAVPEEAELLEQMVEARQHSSQHPTDFSPRLKKEEEEEEEEVANESTRATSTTESKKEKGRLVVECRSNLLSRDESPFTRICSDFEQALKYSKVARFLLFKGNNLYDKWLSLLSYFQDMGELRHQKHEHVAYETEEWRNAYFIELQLLNCIPFVSSSLRKHLITYDGKSHFFEHSQPFLRTKHVIRQCLAAIERCYDSDDVEWKRLPVPQVVIEDERNDQEGMMELEHQHPQKTIPALSYSLLQNPVSVHISLHRMLSAFLFEIGCRERLKPHHLRSNYHSANQQSDEDQLKSLKRSLARFGTEVESESHLHISLEELFFGGEKQKQEPNRTEEEATEEKGKEKDQATTGTSKELTTTSAGATIEDVIRFLEQPLRCHALFAQIQAGLWNKNGAQTIWGTYSLYKSSFMFGDALDLDILAIQCAAILLGSNNFLALALDRFELSDWFVIDGASVLSQDDTDATLIVAEEFLRFILSIATNRTSISAENNLRRQLIHWLAVKDLPHSQLVDKLKYRSEFDEVFSSERIEATLGEIADYIPPRVGKQGCYSLKPECWAEFDPCFPHFSRQHLSSAAENFQKAAANFSAALEDATAAKKGSILPIRAPARPYLMFERIHDDLLLNSNAVFSILFTVLYNASLVYLSPSEDRSEESSNNKRLVSDYLLDYSLRYLYLMVKCKGSAGPSPPPTTKDENTSSSSSPPSGIPEGTSWRELRFPKEDVIAKLKHEIRFSTVNEKQAATSMLDILLKLSQVAELKDKHELIKKTLEMIGECDVSAQNYIQRVLQPAEEDAESAKKAARERARARILAQMEKSRQAFKQSMGGIEDVGEEVQEGDAMAVARPALASHHNKVECCLCREVKLPYEDNPLGLIGVCKRSRLLNLANRLTAKAITVKGTKEEEKELKGKEKTETPASQNEAKRAKKTKTRSEEEEKEETEESTRDYLEDEMVDADEFVEMEELEDNFRSEVQEGLDIARELEAGLEGLAQPQLLQSFWSFLDRVRGRREEEDEEDEEENEENEEVVDDEEQHLEDEIYQQEWEQQMEDLFTRAEEETSSDKQQPQERKHVSNARKSDEKNLRDAAKNLWRSHVRIGSQIYSCGHVIHVRCFENYLQTRRQATDLFSALEMSLNRNLKEYWCPQCRQFSNVLIPLSPSRYFKRNQAKKEKEKEKEKEDTRWSSEFAAKWLDNTLERGLLSGLREREHTEEESSSASSTSTHEEEQWMKQHLYVFGRQIESICKYRKLAIPSFMRLSSSLPSSSAPSSSADQERGQEDETASSPFSSVTSLFGSAFGGNSSEGDTKREERTVERRRKEELRMALYLCHLFSYDVAALDLALASMLSDGAQVHQSSTMIPQLKPIQLNTLKDFCNVVASFTSSIDESNMLRCLALLSYSMGLSAPEPFSSCSHSVLQRMSLPVLCTNIFDTMVLCCVLRNALQAKDEEDELEEPLSAFSPILCLFYSCYVVQCLLCVYLQQASLGAVSPPPTSHRPTVAPLESLLSCYQHIALCFGDQNRTSSINAEELRQTVKRQCVPFLRQVFFFFQAWNDHPPVFLAHDSKLTASPSGEEEEEGNQEQEENRVEETFERLCEVLHLPSDLDDLFKTSPVAFHSIADDWIHRFLKEMLLERKAVVQDRLEDEKLHQHEMDIVLEEARIATEEVQEEKEEEEEQEEEDLKEQTQKKKEEKTKGRTDVAEEEEEDFITFIQRYVNARKIFATQELALRPPIGLVKPPKLFQDLFHAYLHETCPRCGTVPKKAAVCLICADYLCAHSPCCTFDVGECFEHAVSCGGGTGMFLLVRTSGVLLISDEKACIWGSPYLDQFGEEDVSFRRGKPLRLEERVYNHLNNVFLNQRLDGEILRSDVSSLKQVQSARLW